MADLPAQPPPTADTEVGAFRVDGLVIEAPKRELPVVTPHFEEATRRFLFDALPEGGVMVDVGAHVGTITLPAAQHVGPRGHVHAVEPTPRTAEILEQNIRANDLDNITVHHCAAGESSATVEFHLMDYSYLNGMAGHPLGREVETVPVAVRPLDEIVDGPVDVVKIDVEGNELDVLRGMPRIIDGNPGLVFCIEWNPLAMRSAGAEPLALLNVLEGYGFEVTAVVDEANGGQVLSVGHVWAWVAADQVGTWWGNVIARRP
jgi:FkbM family methyltransferase